MTARLTFYWMKKGGLAGGQGMGPRYGARPLKRGIKRYVQDPLAEMLLNGEIHDGASVKISANKTGLTFNGKNVKILDDEDEE